MNDEYRYETEDGESPSLYGCFDTLVLVFVNIFAVGALIWLMLQ